MDNGNGTNEKRKEIEENVFFMLFQKCFLTIIQIQNICFVYVWLLLWSFVGSNKSFL